MRRLIKDTANKGFTLVELMIATAVIATVIGLSMVILKQASDSAAEITVQAHHENRLQEALSDMVMRAVESNPSRVTLFGYDEADGTRQGIIVFPTARDADDDFRYVDATGNIVVTPQWQGLVIYAVSNNALYRYIDYNFRTYTNAAYVRQIDATTITVYDGAGDITLNRDGTPANAGQNVTKLLDNVKHLFAYYEVLLDPGPPPVYEHYPPFVGEEGSHSEWVASGTRYENVEPPVHLEIEVEIPVEHRAGQTLVISLDTSVLARNQN